MKRQMKWVAGVVSVALAVTMVALPQVTHAQGQTVSSQSQQGTFALSKYQEAQLLDSLKRISAEKKTQVNSADVTNATSATYTGAVKSNQFHYYAFEVATGGVLQISGTTTPYPYPYGVRNLSTNQDVSPGDTISPGFYVLEVYTPNGTEYDYNLQLSGFTFNGTPDTTLPNLQVTSLDNLVSSLPPSGDLPKGTAEISLTGSADGATQVQYWQDPLFPEPVSLGTTFDEKVATHAGYNEFIIDAQNANANGVTETYAFGVPNVERMAGADRYATSVEISKRIPVRSNVYNVNTVVIATGTSFPDALSGAPLATLNRAPLLLTKPTSLPDVVKQEIIRRKATNAIILGGTGAVSTAVETELKSAGIKTIVRYAGKDRYETSAKIAATVIGSGYPRAAFIVTGENYADALSVSAPAGAHYNPILLVKKDTIPTPIANLINSKNMQYFYIAGGTGVVSNQVQTQLAAKGGTVTRLAGTNRYETSLAVAKYFTSFTDIHDPEYMVSNTFQVANGDNFPDALSQGVLGGDYLNSTLLLTKATSLDPAVGDFLAQNQPTVIYISGGTSVVSTDVENQLYSYVHP